MPETTDINASDYKRIKPREFLDISLWTYRFIYKFSPKATIIYTISELVLSLFPIINTYILARLIDLLVENITNKTNDLRDVYIFIASLFGFSLFRVLVRYVNTWGRLKLNNESYPYVIREFYRKINSFGIQMLEQPTISNKIHRADRYLQRLSPYFFQTLEIIAELLSLVVTAIVVWTYMPWFIPVVVILGFPIMELDKRQRSSLYKFVVDNTENTRKAGRSSGYLMDTVPMKEIVLTQAFNFLSNKYWEFFNWFTTQRVKMSLGWRRQSSYVDLAMQPITLFFIFKVILDAINGLISTGDMLFRYRNLEQLRDSYRKTLTNINDLSEQAIQLLDVYSLFNTFPELPKGNLPIQKLAKGPEITFDHVNFSYPNSNKIVLNNINLKIKSGEKIAIVGANGAGKTTLVKLLCKLYQFSGGKILINNKNLKDINSDDWHKNIGILFQDFNHYNQLTVKENIIIGNADEKVDEVAIRLAADQADASEFINELPQKYDQILDEKFKGGVRLSSGQWQKLAIARFFYRNSPLVIFDEPTASIDAVSEYNIFNKIYEFFKGKTVIIISHRFSTVRNADRIYVLDQGKIVEHGTHQQLMAINGKYAEAFLLQAKGYVDSIA